jgi:hypothetical protein
VSSSSVGQSRPPLRVGLFLDGLVQPSWIKSVVVELQRTPCVEVVVVALNGRKTKRRKVSLRELVAEPKTFLYRLYAFLDHRLFRADPDPFRHEDLATCLDGVHLLEVVPERHGSSEYFPDEALRELRSQSLDVAVRFGFGILRGAVLEVARYGIWSWHHGDNLVNRGGPPGYWEVMEPQATTGSMLQQLTEDLDAGTVIYRSWATVDPTSVTRNVAPVYWKSARFLRRCLEALHRHGPDALTDSLDPPDGWRPYSRRLYRNPTNLETARHLARLIARTAWRRVRALAWRDQWQLGWHIGPVPSEPNTPHPALYRYRSVVPPRDRFWADPFVAFHDDRWFVFVEEYLYSQEKGRIAVAEVHCDRSWTPPQPVLGLPDVHLSYPCVFSWDGSWYMVPEAAEHGGVTLYRAARFPHEWEPEAQLLSDVHAVDATPFEYEGRWWMFVNIASFGATTLDELHLYSATTPLGPWTPHEANPVVSDVRCARPAGRPFVHAGRLHRVGQDSSRRYGGAIAVMCVDRLDQTAYTEHPVGRIDPTWARGLSATHTINAAHGLSVVDVQRRRRR